MKIYINGQFYDQDDAKISVFDRSYLFGEGLFETMCSYDGVIAFLDKHLERLEWSATFVGLPFPHPSDLKQALYQALKENNLENARLKLVLSSVNPDSKAQAVDENAPFHVTIFAEDYKELDADYYERGVGLAVLKTMPNDPMPLSSLKSTNWLTKMMARREIQEKNCFEGILLDAAGHVTECSCSNLFWMKDGKLHTAPGNLGLLKGITRAVIIEIAEENSIPFEESLIKADDLKKVDEVFISASGMQVMPIVDIDGATIGKGEVGDFTKKFRAWYKERIQEEKEV